MSSTSKKHSNFVSEPMRNKRVTEVPGIGGTYGDRLSSRGYGQARDVLGQYLTVKGDEKPFRDFVMSNAGANSKSTGECYQAMKQWTDNFM
ncbi:barrier to autointegration factor 2 [Holotrichia oblita]|uniref:Barrier to autointegration factor 2 n=2 Tax=Holotrichia oblita TaxID=644536 RepID=A0ACB9T788_HOLOL|nr:barrier to autointegration factor 2 [Holotrichia oblita]KAI4462695.1 barrier to autointegration factor 2 [Holotrichia oblita]